MSNITEKTSAQSRKRERFVKIAESRVNRILDAIEALGKCSNKRNYEFSEKDIRVIFREIEKKVKETKSMFLGTSNKSRKFQLGE